MAKRIVESKVKAYSYNGLLKEFAMVSFDTKKSYFEKMPPSYYVFEMQIEPEITPKIVSMKENLNVDRVVGVYSEA